MLTAHVPAGYVLARTLPQTTTGVMPIVLIGSILPDFDMLFFYFVDNGAIHHHRYWVHIPFFWLCMAVVTLPLLAWQGLWASGLAFFAAIALHLVLDTIGGGIAWAAPFDMRLIEWVTVPASQSHWILSFLLHWTFLLELAIWITAATLLWQARREVTP